MDDVRGDIETARYAIFDDMQGGFKFFPSYKGWLGAQATFTVSDKYRHKFTIEWGRPTIWLCNDDAWSEDLTNCDVDWLFKNVAVVHLTTPIFRAST